jgi:ABC-type spermidine/putrescine transport system permease subunit II
MPSPDRSLRFVAFLALVFMLGVITPAVGIGVSALVIDWLQLDGPWPTIVFAVICCAVSVLGALATLRLDDLRRRRT